uniref:Cytochrome C biogenesis protein n=1 Tax=Rhizobium leguminosarum TaxID=384 RepID=A0A179BFZ6_RHILE|nr:cytochrome c biogenesis protein CcdA [Rhizobium leguminosarum]OAP90225.1 cytochrome C biogenesis protein [Rhizobium leguminosarum]
MSAISNIGLVTAFSAGLISFLSPCVLPLVPGYVSYVSGNALGQRDDAVASRLATLLLSLCFVLGFSTVFVAFGATATAVGRLLLFYRYEGAMIGGAVVVLLGVFMTGLIRIPWFERDLRFHGNIRGGRPFGALLLGLAFGFGWTPCIGPVLGAILTVSALSSTAAAGIVLLFAYSLGLGVPFLLSAAFADRIARRLKAMRRLGRTLQIGAGGVMVAMGIAMITGTMSAFSFWLLENVPMLARIG